MSIINPITEDGAGWQNQKLTSTTDSNVQPANASEAQLIPSLTQTSTEHTPIPTGWSFITD
ncbi:MAG: hypothetical protein WCV73_02255 [Patescibacteria group bacterium]